MQPNRQSNYRQINPENQTNSYNYRQDFEAEQNNYAASEEGFYDNRSVNELPFTHEQQLTEMPEPEIASWEAKDSLEYNYGAGWYTGFGIVFLAVLAFGIFILKDWVFCILSVVMAVAVIVHISHPPRAIRYRLTSKGLYVNDHLYDYADFKAFGLIKDGENYSILMIPVKRFSPGVSVYFPKENGEQIVDILGARFPMEQMTPNLIDKFIRKIRL